MQLYIGIIFFIKIVYCLMKTFGSGGRTPRLYREESHRSPLNRRVGEPYLLRNAHCQGMLPVLEIQSRILGLPEACSLIDSASLSGEFASSQDHKRDKARRKPSACSLLVSVQRAHGTSVACSRTTVDEQTLA